MGSPLRRPSSLLLHARSLVRWGALACIGISGPSWAAQPQTAQSLLLSGRALWQQGERRAALDAIDRSLAQHRSPAAILDKARLLDAMGDVEQARVWYDKALQSFTGHPEEARIRLRLTLMRTGDGDSRELVGLARSQSADARNRTALVLAVMGRYAEALELFTAAQLPQSDRTRDEIRRAEWAIRAGNAGKAQSSAWEAAQHAVAPADRRYAFSLLAEASRMDGSVDRLIGRLGSDAAPTAEARELRIDLLRAEGRYDEALAALNSRRAQGFTRARRLELIHVYQEAGHGVALREQYRRLIAQEPSEVSWYEALSEYELLATDRDRAGQVWRDYLRANGKDQGLRLSGVQSMARMGFDELAVTTLEETLRGGEGDAGVLLALFDLHLQRGRAAQAQAVLARLDSTLASSSPARADLADAYERLNQPAAALAVWERRARQPGGLSYEARMRVAKLYEATHQPAKALETWRSLWGEMSTPAQRSLVEDRLLGGALAQGELEALAVDLEQKLASGKGNRNDSSLLVRLYTRARANASAVEVIQEYIAGRGGTLEALKEQVRVYRLLDDHASYRRASRQLIEADPAHRDDYLRGIILDRIDEAGPQLVADLRALLAELRSSGSDERGGVREFEAGVLALAGLDSEAAVDYRRAIAATPANGDNYLLLASLLKKNRRTDEALGRLQWLAESAPTDDLFGIAIDGLLNVLARDGGGSVDAQAPILLRWMQRVVMERLALRGETAALYRLLADVSEDAEDGVTDLAAVEALLDAEPALRGATLRELLTMTANPDRANAADTGLNANAPLHLAFGRRLLALREALPPDAYVDVGTALLRQKSPAEAARVFDVALDTTGQAGLLKRTAELFESAGYAERAAERYARASLADATDIDLLWKYARLRERVGEYAEAHGLYSRALLSLLTRQPIVAQPGQPAETRVTRAYRDLYAPLLQGYLMTWPAAPEAQRRALDELISLVQADLESPFDEAAADPLALHPRLKHASELLRRVAFATGNVQLADDLDAKLLVRFKQDALLTELVAQRAQWGLFGSAHLLLSRASGFSAQTRASVEASLRGPRGDRPRSFEDALVKAERTGSFDTARSLSLLGGDRQQILAVARAWARSGDYQAAMNWAAGRLSEREAASLARYVTELVRKDPHAIDVLFFDGFGSYCRLLEDLEARTGQRVFAKAMLQREVEERLIRQHAQVPGTAWRFIVAHEDPEWVVGLLGRIVAAARRSEDDDSQVLIGWTQLVRKPLPTAVSVQLAEIMNGMLAGNTQLLEHYHEVMYPLMGLPDLDPANVELARAVVATWQRRGQEKTDYAEPFFLLRGGHSEAAIDAFMALLSSLRESSDADQSDNQFILDSLRALFIPAHEAAIRGRLAASATQPGETAATLQMQDLLFEDVDEDIPRTTHYLERASDAQPGNRDYAVRLQVMYSAAGWRADALRQLEKLHAREPAQVVYSAALFRGLMDYDNPARALALNAQVAEDLGSDRFIRGLQARKARLGPVAQSLTMPELRQSPVFTEGDAHMLRLALARAIEAGQARPIRDTLRAYWQSGSSAEFPGPAARYLEILDANVRTAAEAAQPEIHFQEGNLLESLQRRHRPAASGKLFLALATQPFAVEEFESYLRAVNEDDRDQFHLLYDALAIAYRASGRAPQELARLAAAILTDAAGNHEFTLWLELAAAEPDGRATDIDEVLEHRLQLQSQLSQTQLLSVARLYAAHGRTDRAVEAYRLLAARTLVMPTRDPSIAAPPLRPFMTALEFVDELGTHLESGSRAALLRSVFMLTRPDVSLGDAAASSYARFVMRALEPLPDAEAVLVAADELAGEPAQTWDARAWLQRATLEARARQEVAALKSLGAAVQADRSGRPFGGVDPEETDKEARAAAYARMLGFPEEEQWDSLALVTDHVFPPEPRMWTGASEWMRRSAQALADGIRDGGADRNRSLEMMTIVAYRLHEASDVEGSAAVVGEISDILASDTNYAPQTLSWLFEVTQYLGLPLSADATRALLSHGQLDIPLLGPAIRRIAVAKGAAQALADAEHAASYTQNDALLAALVDVAHEAGNEERANYWNIVRASAAQARERIRSLSCVDTAPEGAPGACLSACPAC